MPEMIYVDSSNIESVGYEEENQELHIRFLSGALYIYHEVPRQVFDEFVTAASKGSYLNRVIKDVYKFTKQ